MWLTLNAWLWCVVQTSLVATIALAIAATLRGRHPQWTSAILAGACVSTLTFAILALLPPTQWSLADTLAFTRASMLEPSIALEESTRSATTSSASTSAELETDNHRQLDESSRTPSPSSFDPTRAIKLNQLMGNAANWLLGHVQQFDDQLRAYEQTVPGSATPLAALKAFTLVAVLALSGLWLAGWHWIRRLVRESTLIEDEQLRNQLGILCQRMRCKVPEVRQSVNVSVGATIGCWNRRIILNNGWLSWSDDELQAVLLHELAHLVRGDFAWVVLGSWIRILFFYHPLIQLLVRRWRMEQELAADQLAATWMTSARAYGRALASLALHAQTSAKVPAAVLTAEQVCIVRRVTMLKQGSLRPSQYRWRGVAMLTIITIAGLMPLSGLRGTQVLDDDTALIAETVVSDEAEITLSDEQRAQLLERKRTQEAYPPLSIGGRLKWSPGKLLTPDVDPKARYLQDLIAFALFEQFPEQAEIQCPASITMSWEDMQREHGRLELGAMCNESHGVDPRLFTRLATSRFLGRYKQSEITKSIEGLAARGLVCKCWDDSYTKFDYEAEPSRWVIQNGDQFFFGTEEEVAISIRKSRGDAIANSEVANSPLIEVPAEFEEDFQRSALSLVYADCHTWLERIRNHVQGSAEASEFSMAYPFLEGLEKLGAFVNGENGATLKMRLKYSSVDVAEVGVQRIEGLITTLRLLSKSEEDVVGEKLLSVLKVEQVGLEAQITAQLAPILQFVYQQDMLDEKVEGWHSILSFMSLDHDEAVSVEGKLITWEGTSTGTIKLANAIPLGTAAFLAQSLNGDNYVGRRVRLSAEMRATRDLQAMSGLIVWASDAAGTSLGHATSGNSIGNVAMIPNDVNAMLMRADDTELEWQSCSVEVDVPVDAQIVSLGIYTAVGDVLVRNVRFEVLGPSTGTSPARKLAELPRNLLHVPGSPLLEQPVNLDFSQIIRTEPEDTSDQAAETRSASVPSEGQSINR